MEATEQMMSHPMRVTQLAERARRDPTPANWVAHAVARWETGCTNGAAGECQECNAEFLRLLRERLTVPERWVATGMMGGAVYRSIEFDRFESAQTTARQWAGIGLQDVRVERVS